MSNLPETLRHESAGIFYAAKQAIQRHASSSSVLIIATVAALVVANLPQFNSYYFDFWNQEVRLQLGHFNLFSHSGHPMTLLEFINDALMAVFFFSIGLEIKREILVGELSSIRKALLPIIGACGGMAVPVILFVCFSRGTDYAAGAAIPMATDIAFSLGILSILGSRVPVALKVFLTTLAVVDDIGGIIVIATCYSQGIELYPLLLAVVFLGILILGQYMRIQRQVFYIFFGGVVWFLFLNSGLHPTIAGVLVAFCVPAKPVYNPKKYVQLIRESISHFRAEDDELLNRRSILTNQQMDWLKQVESASDKVISPLQELEDTLHPIVNFFIIPLFAFANAGIFLLDMDPASVVEGVSLAVIVSLVAGKFLGIFSFSWLAVMLKIAPKPQGATWYMMAGASMLGGIGFTVSLFIANLSFGTPAMVDLLNHAKLGIVGGSLIAGILGFLMLAHSLPKHPQPQEGE